MNKHEAVIFLFAIAKEIKRSFEKPVIFLTHKDYGESIFDILVQMRSSLLQQANSQQVLEIVNSFHNDWLTAITEIQGFRKRLRGTPRETVFKAIDYTKECVKRLQKTFSKYVTRLKSTLTEEEMSLMDIDMLSISDSQRSVCAILAEKQNTLRNTVDPEEYHIKVLEEIDELLNWLDTMNDSLAIQFSKVLGLKFPNLLNCLTKTLQQIIEDITMKDNEQSTVILSEIQRKGRRISNIMKCDSIDEIKVKDIVRKIKVLENRRDRLKVENSSAVMALEHKTRYLEERLQSLEDLKRSLITLKSKQELGMDIEQEEIPKEIAYHIFDHLLPAVERGHLVEDLMILWREAIIGINDTKSIISILSANDLKQVYADELGNFVVDKYGRKVYKTPESRDYKYQSNEKNKLVPLSDDDKYVYFFDECGRYYINDQQERIYKADENASEYLISHEGMLVKVSETVNGKLFYYDDYGRYYLEDGKRIYEGDGVEGNNLYESDGLGNLVRIRTIEPVYEPCTAGRIELEENKYLRDVVGDALKTCLARMVILEPEDPVLFLSECLVAYRRSQKLYEQRMEAERELMAERERHMRENADPGSGCGTSSDCGTEATTIILDKNFVNYKSMEIP